MTILRTFIEINYQAALVVQTGIQIDQLIVPMLAGAGSYDEMVAKRFMAKYNLLRNCSREEIKHILAAFHRFWLEWREKEGTSECEQSLTSAAVEERFTDLFKRLYRVKPRNWISATSKLLWCMYPRQLVIYDRFVQTALTTLQPLEPALASMSPYERIGSPQAPEDKNGIGISVKHYMRVWAMVHVLLTAYGTQLAVLQKKHGVALERSYIWDIRVLDRLLVFLGNPNWAPSRKGEEGEGD
jgi:hypothetical protein